jgi:hypothetical protein
MTVLSRLQSVLVSVKECRGDANGRSFVLVLGLLTLIDFDGDQASFNLIFKDRFPGVVTLTGLGRIEAKSAA